MIASTLTKIFGTSNERVIKRMAPMVEQTGSLEPAMEALSGEELRAKTLEFRARIAARLDGIDDAEERVAEEKVVLGEILPEAFAVVREAGRRVLQMRHFDVQLIGGMVLHQGKIAEMKTGEGKTLVATLPCYLNALAGHGVHVVTVNDYLAKRDAEWMGKIYEFLGLSVGVIVHDLDDAQRPVQIASDQAGERVIQSFGDPGHDHERGDSESMLHPRIERQRREPQRHRDHNREDPASPGEPDSLLLEGCRQTHGDGLCAGAHLTPIEFCPTLLPWRAVLQRSIRRRAGTRRSTRRVDSNRLPRERRDASYRSCGSWDRAGRSNCGG